MGYVDVKIGQVWKDNDKRYTENEQRELEIVGFYHDLWAVCKNLKTGKTSKILIDRFRPNSTGYRLIKDVSNESETK